MSQNLFVVGPLLSQHIQVWFKHFTTTANVTVLTVHEGGKPLPEAMQKKVFSITGTRLDFFLFAPVFWLLWWWHRPVVTNFHYLSSYGLLSLLLPKRNLVLNVWGSDVNLPFKSKNKLKRFLIKKALQRYSWINAPAEHLKQKLIALGAAEEKIEVFQYGVNVNDLPIKAKATDKAELIVVSNRNWQALYRIELIVAAFCLWQQQPDAPPALLHLYGTGDNADIARVNATLARYPTAASRVTVMGYTDKDTMLQQMAQADIFVSVPERDGTPLSLLEAMYIGLLPVVSDIDANHEWLVANSALWLTTYQPAALAALLAQAVTTLASSNEWQAVNRDKVAKLADVNQNLPRFYAVLQRYIGDK
ncbi:hypothetical protein GCM10010919_17150 [Alishewanella longhuensis]|uniref:Glycosyltransferase subfamily 4-like N-terminal domain-containing protein n=1 Tax=Alishewanella longhuensis TaxID=1091037 RepID=A0ABQ3KZ22_9ALTE|nr:glycosyltransferase [Alishewanella longhuensis]GHG68026.1 hypothetical protein GCM10010919_17150 [Alishewanella longhuensis]